MADLQTMVRTSLTRLGTTLSEQAVIIMEPPGEAESDPMEAAIATIRRDVLEPVNAISKSKFFAHVSGDGPEKQVSFALKVVCEGPLSCFGPSFASPSDVAVFEDLAAVITRLVDIKDGDLRPHFEKLSIPLNPFKAMSEKGQGVLARHEDRCVSARVANIKAAFEADAAYFKER